MGAVLFYADRLTDGQMERHNEDNCRFSQICKRA